MIQSQSLGGSSSNGGGGTNGGEKDYNERHSSRPSPPPRHDRGDIRIHRHDSREQMSNGVSRDWRRQAKPPHEVYRRDHRKFRDRWKDRKRWEKPRMREPTRDDLRLGPQRYPYQKNLPKEVSGEPSNNTVMKDFRNPFGLGSYSQKDAFKTHERRNLNASRPRLPYDEDLNDELHHEDSKSITDFQGDATNHEISHPKTDGSQLKHPKKFSRRPGDKFRDLIMSTERKPNEFVKDGDPQQETSGPSKKTHKKPVNSDTKAGAKVSADADITPPKSNLDITMDITANEPTHKHLQANERETKIMQPGSNNTETHSISISSKPTSDPDNALVADNVGRTNEVSDSEQAPNNLEARQHNNATEYDAVSETEQQLDAHNDDTDPMASKLSGELDRNSANNLLNSPSQTSATMLASNPMKPAAIQEDVKTEFIEERPRMLPQEFDLHKRLVAEYDSISQVVTQSTYSEKNWKAPEASKPVLIAISKRKWQEELELEERYKDFRNFQEKWLQQTSRLDYEADSEKLDKEAGSKPPKSASNHTRKRSRDEDSTVNNQKIHRRSRDRHSRVHGDVARSEAEFLEILASLEAQTARDPLVRARLTSAQIPNQSQVPESGQFKSTNALVIDHSILLRRLNYDGLDTFTPDEHTRFVDAYVRWPKEFGKIADVVGRSFNDCVMHYYRTKKQENYKRILLQRTKKKRGRKPRRRLEEESPSEIGSRMDPHQDAPPTTTTTELRPSDENELAAQNPTGDLQYADHLTEKQDEHTPNKADSLSSDLTMESPSNESKTFAHKSQPISADGYAGRYDSTNQFTDTPPILPSTGIGGVPPPVLPLHQMDTLASAAMLEKREWDSFMNNEFERLIGVYGTNFEQIATNMGIDLRFVISHYEAHPQRYQTIIQHASAIAFSKDPASLPIAEGAKVQVPFNGPTVGFFPPRNAHPKLPPVVQPPNSHENLVTTPLHVPPPVLPLESSPLPDNAMTMKSKVSDSTLEYASESTIVGLTSESPAMALPGPSKEALRRSPIPLEFEPISTAIPAVLPRTQGSSNHGLIKTTYNALAGNTFDGFQESNERH